MTPIERLRSDLVQARQWAEHFATQAERGARGGRHPATIRAAERKAARFSAKAAEYERAVAVLAANE